MNTLDQQPQQEAKAPNGLQVMHSVAASFFGVQSSRNWQRDFTTGKPWHYIAAGTLMTGFVIFAFCCAVKLALYLAAN